jgi:threonine/homoserine/homoserine lactone efflux protein
MTMGQAIGQVLSFGVGVSLSPVPIIAVVLMLGTPHARSNGPGFVLGWITGLTVVSVIVLLISNGADAQQAGKPATWTGWLKLVLGVALLLLAFKQWRGRPRGQDPELPKWMATIDRFTVGRSIAMGVALSAINPKNLLLTVGAAAAIAQTGASTGSEIVAVVVFVLIGTIGPGLPVAIYFLMPDRAERLLGDVKAWMARENVVIMAVLCLVIGAKLLGDGIQVLTQ